MAYDYAMGTSIGSDDSVKWRSRFRGGFRFVAAANDPLLLNLDYRLFVH
jgi:hypothetical protein